MPKPGGACCLSCMSRPPARSPGAVRLAPIFVSLVTAATVAACDAGEPPLDAAAVDDEPVDETGESSARDLADGVVSDHGYDGIISHVALSWDASADGPTVAMENRTHAPIVGSAFVDVRGLGLQDLRHDLGELELAPGETTEIAIDPSKLPLRASQGSVWVEVGFEMDHRGQPIEYRTDGGRLDFDDDQKATHFDAAPPVPQSVEAALEQASMTAFGNGQATIDGTQLGVANDPADPRGPITFPGLFPPPFPPIPPLPSTSRVCPTWRVHYVDPNAGQEFMGASGVQHVPASYAHITIRTPSTFTPFYQPGVHVYSGYLDEDGCTSQLDLDGNYIFSLTTKHRKGTLDVEVKNNDSSSGHFGYANGSFTAGTLGSAVFPTTSEDTRHTRSAAIVSRALATEDLPFASALTLLEVYADQNCPMGGFAACSRDSRLFIGRNPSGEDMSLRRHIVAHELGHNVSGSNIGHPTMAYGEGDAPTSQPLCRCDHVEIANQAHCLQSRETLEVAFVEGFAHFAAAKLFNDLDDSTCRFTYYKEFLMTSNTVDPPPVFVSCNSATRWMERRGCAGEDRGTEWDWMNFLWVINQSGTLTLPELFDVMQEACRPGGGGGCHGATFDYADIQAAVDNSTTLTSSQKSGFNWTAAVYGVDH